MNFLLETIRLGLANLRLHMLRSVLTSLGIILGVGAVIVMVSIGEGNKQAALRDIQALGATNVIVRSTLPPESSSFGSEERSYVASYGITRADFRYDDTENDPGALYILEINTQPGMTPLSLVPEMAAHEGMGFDDLVNWMVEDASCLR